MQVQCSDHSHKVCLKTSWREVGLPQLSEHRSHWCSLPWLAITNPGAGFFCGPNTNLDLNTKLDLLCAILGVSCLVGTKACTPYRSTESGLMTNWPDYVIRQNLQTKSTELDFIYCRKESGKCKQTVLSFHLEKSSYHPTSPLKRGPTCQIISTWGLWRRSSRQGFGNAFSVYRTPSFSKRAGGF
jgi:hypothetical protein